jgi:hypothetical protein
MTSEQRPPVNNDHFLSVPRVVVVIQKFNWVINSQFDQHFTNIFLPHRSQKRKKRLMARLSFCSFGIYTRKSQKRKMTHDFKCHFYAFLCALRTKFGEMDNWTEVSCHFPFTLTFSNSKTQCETAKVLQWNLFNTL